MSMICQKNFFHIAFFFVAIFSILLASPLFPNSKTIALATSGNSLSLIGEVQDSITENPSCGQVIKGEVKLISNLICTGDGLIVGDKNTRIDLNGFSIKGPGMNSNKVGIMIGGQENTTITGNGIISGFQSGIYISGSNDTVARNLNINNNKVALYVTGSTSFDITNNMVSNNTIGIASHTSDQTNIKYNLFSENNLSGITFINTVDSVIDGNNIFNTTNGVFLDVQSSFNRVNFNNVFNNVLDINNANSLPININKNYFTNNNCISSLPSGLCIGR
ncbi:MAG: right-handed parallel beta-helix repeat-containing protein [Candidatus Nitrosocosmicus sp.]